MKRCSTLLVIKEVQIKTMKCITSTRMARIKMSITTVGYDVEKLELSLMEMSNSTATLEKFDSSLTGVGIRPSNFTPMYVTKRNKNLYPHRNLYTDVRSSIYNSQQTEIIQISIT